MHDGIGMSGLADVHEAIRLRDQLRGSDFNGTIIGLLVALYYGFIGCRADGAPFLIRASSSVRQFAEEWTLGAPRHEPSVFAYWTWQARLDGRANVLHVRPDTTSPPRLVSGV